MAVSAPPPAPAAWELDGGDWGDLGRLCPPTLGAIDAPELRSSAERSMPGFGDAPPLLLTRRMMARRTPDAPDTVLVTRGRDSDGLTGGGGVEGKLGAPWSDVAVVAATAAAALAGTLAAASAGTGALSLASALAPAPNSPDPSAPGDGERLLPKSEAAALPVASAVAAAAVAVAVFPAVVSAPTRRRLLDLVRNPDPQAAPRRLRALPWPSALFATSTGCAAAADGAAAGAGAAAPAPFAPPPLVSL